MATNFLPQPISTDTLHVSLHAIAWEMTKLAAAQGGIDITPERLREEYKKNYKAVHRAHNHPDELKD